MAVRLGIVGCGAIAEATHLPAARHCRDVDLVALVDPHIDRAVDLAKRFGVQYSAASLDEVAERIDAVILATPPHVRPKLAERAFELGLHVLCEKPLANSVAECDRIIEASKAADRVLAVAHVFRFWPSRIAIADYLASGKLGRIEAVWVSQGNPYSWKTQTGYNMRPDLVPGGVLIDAGIHPLDTLLWWFGDPQRIQYQDDSLGGLESNVRLLMEFPDDIKVCFRQSRTCSLPNEFRIVGEQATLTLSNYNPSRFELLRGEERKLIDATADNVDAPACERQQLQDFIDSVQHRRAPRVTGQEGRRVIDLIEKSYSQRTDRTVINEVPLPGLTW